MFRKWLSLVTIPCTCAISISCFTVTAQTDDNNNRTRSYYSSVIIGAGWAGIGVAASLKHSNVNDFIILEKGNCIGYFWSTLYDSIRMNTYQHRLWHSPSHIEPNQIEDYRSKHGVLDYLNKYCKHYHINPHLQFNKQVKHIKYDKANHEWILNLHNGEQIHTSVLTIASSINRVPYIPNFMDMDKFDGTMLHTSEYSKGSQFDDIKYKNKKRKFLVIGCGNSAIEIAGEIKKYNEKINNVTLLIRNGRHFTKEKTKHRFESVLDKICSPSPFSEQSLMKDNLISCNDLSFHTDIINFDKFTDFMIFTDMTKYGIPKPKLSPTADHYYNKKLAIVDRGTIAMIKKKKINIISATTTNKTINRFTKHGVEFEDGTHENFDVIIFGTGYRHGLHQLFEHNIWKEISTNEYKYPDGLLEICKDKNIEVPMNRAYDWPDLNGRGRSNVYQNLYFAGFDQGYLGGLTIGLYSWSIGEEIAVQLGKISVHECTMPWIKTDTLLKACNYNTDLNKDIESSFDLKGNTVHKQ